MKESSEVPGTACLILREEKERKKRKPEGGNAQVGKRGGCKVGRVAPYSITPNLGWPARGSHN